MGASKTLLGVFEICLCCLLKFYKEASVSMIGHELGFSALYSESLRFYLYWKRLFFGAIELRFIIGFNPRI